MLGKTQFLSPVRSSLGRAESRPLSLRAADAFVDVYLPDHAANPIATPYYPKIQPRPQAIIVANATTYAPNMAHLLLKRDELQQPYAKRVLSSARASASRHTVASR